MKSNCFLRVRGASGGLGRPREAGSQEATFWGGAGNPLFSITIECLNVPREASGGLGAVGLGRPREANFRGTAHSGSSFLEKQTPFFRAGGQLTQQSSSGRPIMTANCRTVASVVMRTLMFSREMHAQNQLLKDVWDEMAILNGFGRPKRDKA